LKDRTEEDQSNPDYQELQEAYESTCRELKVAHRDIRDQSIEIRDLKRQNTQLHERNATLREQNEQFREAHQARSEKLPKSEKTKYIEHFNVLDDHINHLQHERQKREAHMESLTVQTREANEEKITLEATNRRLQRHVRDLSNNLTECKDDLLRLQPISQISDNEISEQYANLDQQISGWVDEKTEDTQVLEEQIEKTRSVENVPKLFRQYVSSDLLKLAKKLPECQPLLLRYLIHCCLGAFILDTDIYFFGLDARNIALLQGMEEGMRLLEPRRGEQRLSPGR
jgi:chromosome segregation ATPase